MAQIRDSMHNPWWAEMYNRYGFHDPSNKNYGVYDRAGTHQPLTVGGTPAFATRLHRHADGINAYHVGGISRDARFHQAAINRCTSQSGAPDLCAMGYIGPSSGCCVSSSSKYDRLG